MASSTVWDSFPDEMSALPNNLERQPGGPITVVKKYSLIYKSLPVLDDEGLQRMDGRFTNAEEARSTKDIR